MDFSSFKRYISLIFFSLVLLSTVYAKDMKPVVCDQDYALCTSARCIPDPRNPDNAICDCVVSKGKSVGYKTCAEREPNKNKYKATRLISTFFHLNNLPQK